MGYNELQDVTRSFPGVEGVQVPAVTGGYKGLQRVTMAY